MIYGISMVKDEADIIAYTIDHMLSQVDRVIVADNLSTDGTSAILETATWCGRVEVVEDSVLAYNQAEKMTGLAHYAGSQGATWIVPFDADEAWFLPNLKDADYDVLKAQQYIFVPTKNDDENDFNPLTRIRHRMMTPDTHGKMAFRYHPDVGLHMGNHDIHHPGRRVEIGTIRHYMYRSLEQARRKVRNGVAAYEASQQSPVHGSHWRWLHDLGPEGQQQWWDGYTTQPGLVEDSWPA